MRKVHLSRSLHEIKRHNNIGVFLQFVTKDIFFWVYFERMTVYIAMKWLMLIPTLNTHTCFKQKDSFMFSFYIAHNGSIQSLLSIINKCSNCLVPLFYFYLLINSKKVFGLLAKILIVYCCAMQNKSYYNILLRYSIIRFPYINRRICCLEN